LTWISHCPNLKPFPYAEVLRRQCKIDMSISIGRATESAISTVFSNELFTYTLEVYNLNSE